MIPTLNVGGRKGRYSLQDPEILEYVSWDYPFRYRYKNNNNEDTCQKIWKISITSVYKKFWIERTKRWTLVEKYDWIVRILHLENGWDANNKLRMLIDRKGWDKNNKDEDVSQKRIFMSNNAPSRKIFD